MSASSDRWCPLSASARRRDEIVWTCPVSNSNFHLERMDDTVVWFCITARDPTTGKERQLHVNLCSDTAIKIVLQELPQEEWDTPEVQKQKPPTSDGPFMEDVG